MPQIAAPVRVPQDTTPHRIRWTRSQCDAIRDAGILTGRYELIDGEIISKMGQKPPHSLGVQLLHAYLVEVFGMMFVRNQTTIDVGAADPDYNEPEPDLCVTRKAGTAYSRRHPDPADLLLVAEVSQTTVRFDRSKKAALYARAGIEEYWVLDIVGRQAFVHRQPGPDGYADIVAYNAEERIAPLARPDAVVVVGSLLPPQD